MSLVEIGRYHHSIKAELDRLLLAEFGIEAFAFDVHANNFFGGADLMPVRLMVSESELNQARQIIADHSVP